ARLLPRTSRLLDETPDIPIGRLAETCREDVVEVHEGATPYQLRCHLHTVTSAIAEARSWSK
ncbi:MAG: hypothetical protein ACK5JT_04805, partial [Hyphomicrobiaceae bacterium]